MAAKDKLIIFDTTLRDGEQSPGASMTRDEKIRIAKMLEKMRVDVIEAGFAIPSQGDFESVRAVAEVIKIIEAGWHGLDPVEPKSIVLPPTLIVRQSSLRVPEGGDVRENIS